MDDQKQATSASLLIKLNKKNEIKITIQKAEKGR
jgi:hypothetical protein